MNLIVRTAGAVGAVFFAASLFAAVASADISGNDNTSTQTGTNSSTSTQAAAAVSGNATSAGTSTATSGSATAQTVFNATQALNLSQYIQTDVGAGVDISGNTNVADQAAGNLVENDQENAAASGAADASGASTATTGDAASVMANVQNQIQTLLQSVQSAFP